MPYIIIDDATGVKISGPHDNDAGVQPGAGQVTVDVPGSYLLGLTDWKAGPPGARGFVDPPPVYPTPAALQELTPTELSALLDHWGSLGILTASRVAALKLC